MKNSCTWEVIDDFQSYSEFARFTAWVESQVSEKLVSEIPVKDPYAGSGFTERWFQCSASQSVWRLVYPDGPFHGYWGAVT
jgi:hypothetical protein